MNFQVVRMKSIRAKARIFKELTSSAKGNLGGGFF